MKKLSPFLRYLKFYFEPNSKALHTEAFNAARIHFATMPMRTKLRPYPLPADYEYRRLQFQAFQRGYINAYRTNYAKAKLATQ
jgi:hypothetical protein